MRIKLVGKRTAWSMVCCEQFENWNSLEQKYGEIAHAPKLAVSTTTLPSIWKAACFWIGCSNQFLSRKEAEEGGGKKEVQEPAKLAKLNRGKTLESKYSGTCDSNTNYVGWYKGSLTPELFFRATELIKQKLFSRS